MKSETMRHTFAAAAVLVAMAIMLIPEVAAAAAAGGGMPYSTPIQKFRTSLGSEVALILIVVGIVGGGSMWLWGGELSGVLAFFVKLIIVVALIAGGGTAFTTFMGITGAVI